MAAEDASETHRRARKQFAASAGAYVTSASHAAGDDLRRMVEVACLRLGTLSGRRGLDVATGGGHTARALAQAGAVMTVSDLTPEMLVAAEAHLREALPDADLAFVAAAAEALPFEDGAFEVVSCRIAGHHFADPRRFLAEAKRVLAYGGVLLLVDNIAPEDARLGAAMNEVERLRDSSHVEAYTVSRWIGWLGDLGLEPYHLERFWRVKELEPWLARARTRPENAAALRALLDEAPDEVRRYLLLPSGGDEERTAVGHGVRLRHEVMLLAATVGAV